MIINREDKNFFWQKNLFVSIQIKRRNKHVSAMDAVYVSCSEWWARVPKRLAVTVFRRGRILKIRSNFHRLS